MYIKDKLNLSGWGERKIKEKLLQKGIKYDIVNNAMADIVDNEILYQNALTAGLKKKKSIEKYENRKQKDKLFAFLSSRGYKYDIVKKVIDEIFTNEDFDEISF